MKMNASEPLTRRRKQNQPMSKLNSGVDSGQTKEACDYCFRDIRRRDGMSIIQAFTRNVRTFVTDAKGKATSGYPTSANVPMRFQGADVPVVPLKPRNGGGGKGCNCPVFIRRKTESNFRSN